MLSITLPAEVEKRLDALARTTGRSKAAFVREAVMEYLDDLEDLHIAKERLARHRASGEAGIPLETVMKQHGMDG